LKNKIILNQEDIENVQKIIEYLLSFNEYEDFKDLILSTRENDYLEFATCEKEKMKDLILKFKESHSDEDLDEIARNSNLHIYSFVVKIQDKIGDDFRN
jgi:hypothetical protein